VRHVLNYTYYSINTFATQLDQSARQKVPHTGVVDSLVLSEVRGISLV